MRLSSLRLTLLGVIARVLRRWLGLVTAQLEPAAHEAPVPPESPDRVLRQPAPPDHWVELVQQYAPQLLDADAPGVIDNRADGALVDPPQATTVPPKARPLHLLTPQHQPVAASPKTIRSDRKSVV